MPRAFNFAPNLGLIVIFVRTLFMYGHMDKQPPLTDAWASGLGPYLPVIRDGKLYGRGGADGALTSPTKCCRRRFSLSRFNGSIP
jgi:hypothetical protein